MNDGYFVAIPISSRHAIASEQGLSSDQWRATRHRLLLALRACVAEPPRLTHYVAHLYRWERTHLEHLHSLTLSPDVERLTSMLERQQ